MSEKIAILIDHEGLGFVGENQFGDKFDYWCRFEDAEDLGDMIQKFLDEELGIESEVEYPY